VRPVRRWGVGGLSGAGGERAFPALVRRGGHHKFGCIISARSWGPPSWLRLPLAESLSGKSRQARPSPMAIALYTLVGLRNDGVSLSADVVPARSPERALQEARSFLSDHTSCDLVEVYSGGEQVAVLLRGPQAGAA